MKRFSLIIAALALVLGLTQCKKEEPLSPNNNGEKVQISLVVDNGNGNGTRADVTPPYVAFKSGDKILVVSNGIYVGELTGEPLGDNIVFSGTIDPPTEGKPLYFYFLGNNAVLDAAGSDSKIHGCTVNISDQTGYPTMPVISMAPSDADYSSSVTSYTARLHNRASLMKFNVTTPSNSPICITGMNNKVTVDFSKAANDGENNGFTYDKEDGGIIKLKGGSGSPAEKWAIVLPQSELAAGSAGSIYAQNGTYTTFTGSRPLIHAIEANGYYHEGGDVITMTVNTATDIIDLGDVTDDKIIENGKTVIGTLVVNKKISIADGATVTLNGATINGTNNSSYKWAGLTCLGDATIILEGTNSVKGFFEDYPGIFVPSGKTLIIQGSTGSLNASSNGCGAGIGGGFNINCGNIEIQGGVITATGGQSAAGIGGGGSSASCGTITISGGNITANGGESGAGIGTGFNGTCGNITISGGSITANGGASGAGIGTGFNGNCGSITIYNTVTSVTATKGSSSPNSIGPGFDGTYGTVTIGGVVGAITTSPYTYPAPVAPSGALGGKFTVNAGGGQVSFSQGNLQYQASTQTWRFAPNQYDMIGSDNANISNSYTGWIDLFGWGTGNNPTNSSTNNGDYSIFTDWGVNAISNGGNTANMWSTLTKDEWVYLFANHTKGWSNVNDVYGYVIRPDGVSTAVAASYTSSEWAVEEAAGSVFLPAACSRGGTTFNPGAWGDYWTSTPYNSNDAYYLYFHQGGQNPSSNSGRFGGRSVRLVYETPFFQGAGTEQDPYRISSEEEWNYLAVKVNSGTNYAGKFFRQTANIDVTTMVGNSSDSKPFSGTYDGDGKTLNLSLNTSTPHTAPFRLIANATIKNVVTTGTVHSTDNHPSGLVGETDGTCTIQNCRVGANVGGAQHSGGIVGHSMHANIYIIGCVYSGTLSPASGQKTGGILGWGGDGGGHTMTISNCLFAGTVVGSTTFHPVGIVQTTNNTRTVSNTYYTVAHNMSDENTHGNSFVNGLSYKGKFARSITAGTGVTVARTGATAVYDVSGITSYGTGILYDGVLYAGNGEAVSLSLSHTDQSGFSFSQYTVTGGGSLNNPTSNSPTLTMTDADQTINALFVR